MQVFVQCQQLHALSVQESDTVASLKSLVEAREGVSADELTLTARSGRTLEDNQLLSDVLVEGSYVDATVGLLGGKVHGSLARAGKVKGQTPKVEKQEKKKKKTGRAKRRMQYNRRFVNVVTTFGRRRGPNANPGAS
ncbi:ubiquitin protein FUBI isoform 1 [Tropilaelaps mercedesae]|uniref:Ubiquitin protein FUBI isoform 1 n=1 Tax=Tropilaelaps mercedesae TaxID=418985 RepID=A0A1V9XZH2_9ACAR|nr:ubiquitin protein FUBI isoform 1 [Tropilaelaps mercedesae]